MIHRPVEKKTTRDEGRSSSSRQVTVISWTINKRLIHVNCYTLWDRTSCSSSFSHFNTLSPSEWRVILGRLGLWMCYKNAYFIATILEITICCRENVCGEYYHRVFLVGIRIAWSCKSCAQTTKMNSSGAKSRKLLVAYLHSVYSARHVCSEERGVSASRWRVICESLLRRPCGWNGRKTCSWDPRSCGRSPVPVFFFFFFCWFGFGTRCSVITHCGNLHILQSIGGMYFMMCQNSDSDGRSVPGRMDGLSARSTFSWY